MRKLLWLAVVLGVVSAGFWVFTSRSTAQPPQYIDVEGTLSFNGSVVSNHVIQARAYNSSTWSDVETTNGSGYYYWSASGWSNGKIWMRAKNGCGFMGDGVWAADSCYWFRNITGTNRATCNLLAQDCFDDGPGRP